MIPRVERTLIIRFLVAVYELLLALPLGIAYIVVMALLVLAYSSVTLPWTLLFYSSNWGLLSRDRKMMRSCAVQVQTTNITINDMLTYASSSPLGASSHIKFYPHKAERSFFCVPFLMSVQSTTYIFPPLSEVFTRLEDAGWRREDIYDLFAQITNDGAAREKVNDVKKRVCRGKVSVHMNILDPAWLLTSWLDAPLNMWEADREVVDVDMMDVKWILARHALIRPRNMKTLKALDKLNDHLRMWKFVVKEDDLREAGYWQYIVRPP